MLILSSCIYRIDFEAYFISQWCSHLKSHLPTLLNRLTGLLEFFCEKCGEIYGTEANDLITHTENVHVKRGKMQTLAVAPVTRPYLCEVCGKGYTQSSHLYQHLRFHKGSKIVITVGVVIISPNLLFNFRHQTV